jgi:hypothetical protein
MAATWVSAFVNIALMTSHFGGNSKTGGRPPTDSNDMNIMNSINAVSLFAITVRLTDDTVQGYS